MSDLQTRYDAMCRLCERLRVELEDKDKALRELQKRAVPIKLHENLWKEVKRLRGKLQENNITFD